MMAVKNAVNVLCPYISSRNYNAVISIPNINHNRKVKSPKMFAYFFAIFNKDWLGKIQKQIFSKA